MEIEYIALSLALYEVNPFQRLLKVVWHATGLVDISLFSLKKTVFEYNQGCLTLEHPEPHRMTHRSK